jgi:hypothetical protein
MMDSYSTNKIESYELTIVHEDPEDGLTRPGMIETKVVGVRTLDDVKSFRYMFQDMVDRMPGTKIDIGRKITFYCNGCRGIIGTKTIPLRVEKFRIYDRKMSVETEVKINTEMYRCLACGHHTRYQIQDPIIAIY